MSVHAQAQEIYREMVAGEAATVSAATPTPDQRAKKNKKHGRPAPADARHDKVLMLLAEVALKRWTSLQ
jgi:hypothetical protein